MRIMRLIMAVIIAHNEDFSMIKLIIVFIACTALFVESNSSKNQISIINAISTNTHQIEAYRLQIAKSMHRAEDALSDYIGNALYEVEGVLKSQNLIVDVASYATTALQASVATQAHKTVRAVLLGMQALIDVVLRGYVYVQSHQKAAQVQNVVLKKISTVTSEVDIRTQRCLHAFNSMNLLVQDHIHSKISKVAEYSKVVIKELHYQEQYSSSHLKCLTEQLERLEGGLQISKAHAAKAAKMVDEGNQRASIAHDKLGAFITYDKLKQELIQPPPIAVGLRK